MDMSTVFCISDLIVTHVTGQGPSSGKTSQYKIPRESISTGIASFFILLLKFYHITVLKLSRPFVVKEMSTCDQGSNEP